MSIGERILELRKQKNISQVQLAKALGISRQAVSKWENDLAAPDMMNLIHLADLLVTDTEYLATGVHAKQKAQPSIVTVVQRVDNVVEKVVEKPVEVEKIVRYRYLRNPVEFIAVGLLGMIIGFLIGILI